MPETDLLPTGSAEITPEVIHPRILVVRDQNVMIDRDLAELYGVTTKALNQAVKRNTVRFPDDFMFQLTAEEDKVLRSQIVTSKDGRGGRQYLPYAFTEQGVAMLSSVLRSERAVQVNVAIMRAFVAMRRGLSADNALARKILDLEEKYDEQFEIVFEAIRQLIAAPPSSDRRMGFHKTNSEEKP